MKPSHTLFAFLMGFFLYSLTEILLRGYTHWTMALTGGSVMAIIYALRSRSPLSLFRLCLSGALITTAVEFAVGLFDNIIMHWHVWDYSDMPLNFMGQICLPFSCLWFILCFPACFICSAISRRLNSPPP